MQPEVGASDNAQRAQRSSDQFRQIVPCDIFYHFAAARSQRAVRQRNRHTDDQIAQRAKPNTQRAAVIRRKDSADGGSLGP